MTELVPEHPAEPRTDLPEGDGTGAPNQGLVEARDRYRAERDSARQELESATGRIEQMQRAEVERLASAGLSHPSDLLTLSGNELSEYLTEDGSVDLDKVAADVSAILTERPGMRVLSGATDPTQGHGGAVPKASTPSWGAFLKG